MTNYEYDLLNEKVVKVPTYEEKMDMYLTGRWSCPAPPALTGNWDAAAWIKWIDAAGAWKEADNG